MFEDNSSPVQIVGSISTYGVDLAIDDSRGEDAPTLDHGSGHLPLVGLRAVELHALHVRLPIVPAESVNLAVQHGHPVIAATRVHTGHGAPRIRVRLPLLHAVVIAPVRCPVSELAAHASDDVETLIDDRCRAFLATTTQ